MSSNEEILKLLEGNARLTAAEIAVMTGRDETEVASAIRTLEEEKVLLGYGAIVNWERTERDPVTALIEVSITPQRGLGFDRIAARIYQYPQVKSCYLMSGGYDLMVIIEDESRRAVASFVSDRIAPLESVVSTRTHFVLRKYKMQNTIFDGTGEDDREAIVL